MNQKKLAQALRAVSSAFALAAEAFEEGKDARPAVDQLARRRAKEFLAENGLGRGER